MKNVLISCVLIAFGGCVYDPPKKGSEVNIYNQTDRYVFVIDSLPTQGSPRLYDTSIVNERKVTLTRGNNIPALGTWTYFLSEKRYQYQKRFNRGNVTLYFIAEKDLGKTYEEITQDTLYRVFKSNADSLMNAGTMQLFYYNDTIILEHNR